MQQSEWNQITQWYQDAIDYVFVFSKEWCILWQNHSCPLLHNVVNYAAFFGFSSETVPSSGTYTICCAGELYRFQMDCFTEPEKEAGYLIRLEAEPYMDSIWNSDLWRHETENQIAAMRNQVFGISNAVASLYNVIEELSDDCPRELLDEQMQQLNIIKGNCCHLIRPTVFLAEHRRYAQKKEISKELLFLDRELSNFVESCRKILGRSVRLHLECKTEMCVFVNRERFFMCLLCLLLHIKHLEPDVTQIDIHGSLQSDFAVLTFTAESSGIDETPPRHSTLNPFYQTPLISQEESVIRHFCRCYQATLLSTQHQGHSVYALRIPTPEEEIPIKFQSTSKKIQDDTMSLYQIMLSDISNYRFY